MDTNQDYCVYIIRCADGSYYIGSTLDSEERLRAHEEGRASTYTTVRRPLYRAYSEKSMGVSCGAGAVQNLMIRPPLPSKKLRAFPRATQS